MAKCKCGNTKDKNGNCDGSHKKANTEINWINSWKGGNKKAKYELNFRLGTLTVLELHYCPCSVKGCSAKKKKCVRFRLMILNFGFEI